MFFTLYLDTYVIILIRFLTSLSFYTLRHLLIVLNSNQGVKLDNKTKMEAPFSILATEKFWISLFKRKILNTVTTFPNQRNFLPAFCHSLNFLILGIYYEYYEEFNQFKSRSFSKFNQQNPWRFLKQWHPIFVPDFVFQDLGNGVGSRSCSNVARFFGFVVLLGRKAAAILCEKWDLRDAFVSVMPRRNA